MIPAMRAAPAALTIVPTRGTLEFVRAAQEPASLTEAQAEMARLLADMRSIEGQLGDPNRTDDLGRRLSFHEWRDWRNRARVAYQVRTARYRFLKAWVHGQRPLRVGPLVSELCDLVEDLDATAGGVLTPGQLLVLDDARSLLAQLGWSAVATT